MAFDHMREDLPMVPIPRVIRCRFIFSWVIRCRFIFSGKNDALTPDFPYTGFPLIDTGFPLMN